jgi:hypothetical protein
MAATLTANAKRPQKARGNGARTAFRTLATRFAPSTNNPPPVKSSRDEFPAKVIATLGKRAGLQCSICKVLTTGPSSESPSAVTNTGKAAHITAAAPGGARYSAKLSRDERRNITNGIWLCGTHADLIDDDTVTWTVEKLQQTKVGHEAAVQAAIGTRSALGEIIPAKGTGAVRRGAFIHVSNLHPSYRQFIAPILDEHCITDSEELGILMVGDPSQASAGTRSRVPPWTLFVRPKWLRWLVEGQNAGFWQPGKVPAEQILGQVPGWPDSFWEFLEALSLAKAEFFWQRSPKGYPILSQRIA